MRQLVLAGIILCALGAYVLLQGGSYNSQHMVMKVGDMQVNTEEHRTIPQWVGALTVAAGLVLVGAGALGRRRN